MQYPSSSCQTTVYCQCSSRWPGCFCSLSANPTIQDSNQLELVKYHDELSPRQSVTMYKLLLGLPGLCKPALDLKQDVRLLYMRRERFLHSKIWKQLYWWMPRMPPMLSTDKLPLHNIKVTCPAIPTILSNTYQAPIKLFIVGEGELIQVKEPPNGTHWQWQYTFWP